MSRSSRQIEFGDFQTPDELAERVCAFLHHSGIRPAGILEPTCGTGAFLLAASRFFPDAQAVLGVDIKADYLAVAKHRLVAAAPSFPVDLRLADFFDLDWRAILEALPQPLLLVGNPPWVTASRQGGIQGSNLPVKSNFQQRRGLEAKTGKSNFDICEWMTIHFLEAASRTNGMVAFLMKTSVARRVLQYAWSRSLPVDDVRLLRIDALGAFGVNADAGLLFLRIGNAGEQQACSVSDADNWHGTRAVFGMRGQMLAADLETFDRTAHLGTAHRDQQALRWRSGIKHDCAPVLELRRRNEGLVNQLGEAVDVEAQWVFPLLKGSAVANGRIPNGSDQDTFAILTQRTPKDDSARLETCAPRLWRYLTDHRAFFDRRRSSIYRRGQPFSMFGIGSYTFAPWKVAICGLYKQFNFELVGPQCGRPVVLDDTCYHLSFEGEEQARLTLELLVSDLAQTFLAARVFWDAKRPITVELLQQLDLIRLADELGKGEIWDRLARHSTLFERVAG